MTRIFTEGAEMGDTLFWTTTNGMSNVTTTPRSGARCFRYSGENKRTFTAVSEAYFRIGLIFENVGAAHRVLTWYAGATQLGSVRLNSTTNKVEIYTGTASLVATGTFVAQATTWYLFEVHVKIADSGNIDVKVEGTTDVIYSGDTKPGADSTIDTISTTAGGNFIRCDDLAMNDTSNADGLNNNSWCGDGKIQMLTPNADGDSSQLTCSTGTTHYTLVDEVPPNTTDYCESASSGSYDLYGLSNITLAAGETIRRVYVEARVLETTAAGDNVQLGIKSASEDWSTNIPVTTSYARYVGKDYMTDPADSGAWTDTKVNSLQAGMKVV